MLSLILILSASAACLSSGLPFLRRAAPAFLVAAGAVGLAGVGLAIGAESPPAIDLPWPLPWGSFSVAVDGISIIFLIPIFILPALGSLAGKGNGKPTGVFYGALAAAMTLVVIARDGALFLIAWEIMAISAFFAAIPKESDLETRRAGWIYLIATHAGTLFLFAAFSLWNAKTGSFALVPDGSVGKGVAGTVFILSFIGFGFKAGLIPVHVWLPGFYSHAPAHVSGILSGVMSKMGVYGIVRMTGLLPAPDFWWGGSMIAAGAVTAVGGIAFAIGQNNLKRLLAYSSVENIGIIAMGLGLALLGRAADQAEWIALGLGGALFHVWNHGLFKSLLFFNAGAVEREAGTMEIDRLGGLASRMPKTALFFGIGAAAISGLPPLNGFASEILIYLGLFKTVGTSCLGAAVAAAALAMTGALAVACFVKAYSATFLGAARTVEGREAADPSALALGPPAVLALGCCLLGAAPILAAPLLDGAAAVWAGRTLPSLTAAAPLGTVGIASIAVTAAAALAYLLAAVPKRRKAALVGTWDCGYARPDPRMQYTGSSFGRSIVTLFKYALYPKMLHPDVSGLFPRRTEHADEVPDTIQERVVAPFSAWFERFLPYVRNLQQGHTHFYVLYIVIFLLFLLLIAGGVK